MAEISRVGIVGLGTMGAGIAQVCVQAGIEVVGREVDPELGERGRQTIDHYLTRGVEKGRLGEDEKDAALGRLYRERIDRAAPVVVERDAAREVLVQD